MRLFTPRIAGLLALAVVIALLPAFFPNKFYYDVAIKTGINAIVCIGLNLLIGYAGQISLGHAGFYALGGYGSAILSGTYGLPTVLSLVTATLAVGALAYVV
jgi:branched-chain amino acid transport system permease protein